MNVILEQLFSTYRGSNVMISQRELLNAAINVGAPAYNAGDMKRCADVYHFVLQLCGESNLPEPLGENAWSLRYRINARLKNNSNEPMPVASSTPSVPTLRPQSYGSVINVKYRDLYVSDSPAEVTYEARQNLTSKVWETRYLEGIGTDTYFTPWTPVSDPDLQAEIDRVKPSSSSANTSVSDSVKDAFSAADKSGYKWQYEGSNGWKDMFPQNNQKVEAAYLRGLQQTQLERYTWLYIQTPEYSRQISDNDKARRIRRVSKK